jgi:hypothetical protein
MAHKPKTHLQETIDRQNTREITDTFSGHRKLSCLFSIIKNHGQNPKLFLKQLKDLLYS